MGCKFSLGLLNDVLHIDPDSAEVMLSYTRRLLHLGTNRLLFCDPRLQYERDLVDPVLSEIEKPDSNIKTLLQAYDVTVYARFKVKYSIFSHGFVTQFGTPMELITGRFSQLHETLGSSSC